MRGIDTDGTIIGPCNDKPRRPEATTERRKAKYKTQDDARKIRDLLERRGGAAVVDNTPLSPQMENLWADQDDKPYVVMILDSEATDMLRRLLEGGA